MSEQRADSPSADGAGQPTHGSDAASHRANPAPAEATRQHGKPRASRITSWRSAHRSRSHDDAHAEGVDHGHAEKVVAHPLVPRGPVPLITEQRALESLIQELRSAGSFAYDTEFIGELTYHPTLCLIQVATTSQVSLVDPMAALDLRPLWELLADEKVEKIVHAGEQDVEPVARLLGDKTRGARNVTDTQIAAGFVGLAYPVSLLKLIFELLGVKLGKGLTFTHWDQRPLSAVQLRYAADDVRYLPAAWATLKERLAHHGRAEWATAECAEMCDPSHFGFKPETAYQRVRGSGGLGQAALGILRELTIWRDAAARSADVPARALLKDEILVDLARSPVKSVDKLARVRGLPRPIESEYGATIVEITHRALAAPHGDLAAQRSLEPTARERFAADSLYAVACSICASRSIDPALATSRQEIGDLFRRFATGQAMDDLHVLRGWRAEALGSPVLEFLRGQRGLSVRWADGGLHES